MDSLKICLKFKIKVEFCFNYGLITYGFEATHVSLNIEIEFNIQFNWNSFFDDLRQTT